jgi:hypothetical protein
MDTLASIGHAKHVKKRQSFILKSSTTSGKRKDSSILTIFAPCPIETTSRHQNGKRDENGSWGKLVLGAKSATLTESN